MIKPLILKDQISNDKPQDKIRSYGVEIISDVVKINNKYHYTKMVWNSLNEYNLWLMEQKDKTISELENKINKLDVTPPLVEQIAMNKEYAETAMMGLTEVYEMISEGDK